MPANCARVGATEFHIFALVARWSNRLWNTRGWRLALQAVAEEILHRNAVILIEDVIKLDVKIIQVKRIVGSDVDGRSGAGSQRHE